MAKFRHVLPGSPGNNDRNNQGGNNHGNTQGFPKHTPGNIFEQPKNNMKVFHFTELKRNFVIACVFSRNRGCSFHSITVGCEERAILIFCQQLSA